MSRSGVDRNAIASAIGPPLADAVLDGQARLTAVRVPGIGRTVVWRALDTSGAHPWHAYVGVWPDGSARVLTADQDAWSELVAATGARLTRTSQARGYVETYLEVTRGAMVIVRPVTSLDDLGWRPGSAEQEDAKAALLAEPPDMAPTVKTTSDGYHVELTLVVDQRLQRNTFDVGRKGEIVRTSYSVIAADLPLPIAR